MECCVHHRLSFLQTQKVGPLRRSSREEGKETSLGGAKAAPFPAMAVELVGSAPLSAFLEVAFDRLASAEIVDFFRGRKLNEKLLKRLNIMLLSISAVVDDAEQKQIRNRNVKAWLDAVKDAVFEAEDLLDEIDIQMHETLQFAISKSNAHDKNVRDLARLYGRPSVEVNII